MSACSARSAPAAAGESLPLELDRGRLAADLLPVGGLSAGALHRMLSSRLGTSFPHPTLRRIEADSGGNPFIALEIGRALARSGITSVGSRALPVPGTLQGLVSERLGELAPAVTDALHLVAIMPDAPVGHYLGAGVEGADLDVAVLAGYWSQRASDCGSPIRCSPPPSQDRFRRLAAGSCTRSRPDWRAGRRTGQAPRARGDGTVRRVAADLDEAAAAAAARGAPATSAELFELAASLTPKAQPAEAVRRRLAAAGQLDLAGDTRAAIASLEQLMGSTPPGSQRAAALTQLAYLRQDVDGAAATDLLEQALAEAGGDPAQTAVIHVILSENWSKRGDEVRSLAEARRHWPTRKALATRYCSPGRSRSSSRQRSGSTARSTSACSAGHSSSSARSAAACSANRPAQLGRWLVLSCRSAELEEADVALQRVLAWCEAEGVEGWRADVLLRLSILTGIRGDSHAAVISRPRALR